jgi:hypothetical protein
VAVATGRRHSLGFGCGTILEYDDGTAGYVPASSLAEAFRVRIADVTGFSVTANRKTMTRTMTVLSSTGPLAATEISQRTVEKIHLWFRAHPDFGRSAKAIEQAHATLIADELSKLAVLRDGGVLTDDEFFRWKAKLLQH